MGLFAVDSVAKLCLPVLCCMHCKAFDPADQEARLLEIPAADQQAAGSNELCAPLLTCCMALRRARVVRDIACVIQAGVLLLLLML